MEEKDKKTIEKLDFNKLEAKDGKITIHHQHEKIQNARIHLHQPVEIAGTLSAVGNYIEKRLLSDKPQDDLLRCHVLYSYRERYIKLITKENCETLGSGISGSLIVNPDLAMLGINQTKTFSATELVKHLRFNKFYFADTSQHSKLVDQFQNFNATINQEIKKVNDNKGNIDDVYRASVKSNVDLTFNVKMPVFIGEPDKIFGIEIACEATSNSVKFWLESPDLVELLKKDTEELINKQLDRVTPQIVRIEQ